MKIFNVTKVHTISPEEIPGKFIFDCPVNGSYFFTQDEEFLYLYLEGDTNDDIEKVEAIMIQEGEEIPAGHTVVYLAHLGYSLVEEEDGSTSDMGEPVWAVVAVKDNKKQQDKKENPNSWKKSF